MYLVKGIQDKNCVEYFWLTILRYFLKLMSVGLAWIPVKIENDFLLFFTVYLKKLLRFGKTCVFAFKIVRIEIFSTLNVLIKRNRFKFLKGMSMFIHQSVEILNMSKESYAASLRIKVKATDAH